VGLVGVCKKVGLSVGSVCVKSGRGCNRNEPDF
jgi:hypothetical protein